MNNETIDIIIADKAKKEIKEFVVDIQNADKAFLEFAGSVNNFAKAGVKIKLPTELNNHIKESNTIAKNLNKTKQQSIEVEKKLQTVRTKSRKLTSEEVVNQGILRRQADLLTKSNSKLATAYERTSAKLAILKREYKSLAIQQQLGGKLTNAQVVQMKRLERQILKTDGALKKVDKSVGESFRNVGNYSSAMGGLGRSFKSLLGAFGLASGVFLFAGAIRDAFKRVKDFDNSMQNLAGVMRVTRSDNDDLEKSIISIASQTVRTSNEVAQLAETLSTLGKSKDEIKNLLKPIIDLSLGLNASADESGEFLVQMLNTFGKSTKSAGEFADTIASIRTSTTLDFQKMRDSFQYIAPIARLLGKDLAYTGSVVGILADNGLKAESAGRLLSTAQIKLATQGKTLKTALEELNEARADGATKLEVLALANDLFGKQAAKIGAILSVNTDAININAQAIRDSGGALEDLTNQQLESLDAKLKILDSSYERFILNMDSGNSVIGGATKTVLDNAARSFGILDVMLNKNVTNLERIKLGINNFTESAAGFLNINGGKGFFSDFANGQLKLLDLIPQSIDAINAQNKAFVALHGSLAPLSKAQIDLINNQKELNFLFGKSDDTLKVPEDEINSVADYRDQIKGLNDDIQGLSDRSSISKKQKEIKEIQAKIDALLGVANAQKKVSKALSGSIANYNELISSLKKTRDATARNNQEWGEQTREIEKLEKALEMLKIQFNGLNRIKSEGFADGIIEKTKEQIAAEKELLKAAKETTKAFGERNAAQIASSEEAIAKKLEEIEKEKELRDNQFNLANETLTAINAIGDIFTQGELNRLDEKEEANNTYFNNLLDNENLSEEQRSQIEAQREAKAEVIRQKRAEAERKAFLVQQAFALASIGIDLARTIVAINLAAAQIDAVTLGTGGIAYRAANIPFAIGVAAAQVATVVAQTVPAFKDGHQAGTYEGVARINDQKGGLYTEILERKGGKMEMYSGRDQLVNMNKGDKVHTASASQEIMHNMILSDLLSNNGILAPKKENIAGDIAKGMREGFGRMPRNKPQDTGGMAKAIAKELYLLKQIDRV